MKNKEIIINHNANIRQNAQNVAKTSGIDVRSVAQREKEQSKVNDLVNSLTISQQEQAIRQIKIRKARENYEDYVRFCYPNYIFTHFHKYLCKILDAVVKRVEKANMPNSTEEEVDKGRIRLLISVPPRSGKTETLTKTLPSWFIGRNPSKNAILTAYNSEMGEKFNNANRDKIKQYGKEIFGVEVSDSQDNKSLFQLKSGGSCMGVGIQGGITGNGGELIIIDDPYKNSIEANSPATRNTIESVFRDSVLTRLQGKGNALIVIQTRWHEEDLCGKLSKEDGWIVINIPCVCDNEKTDLLHRKLGETLCPELGFDAKWAMATKKSVGRKVWEALYQGHPTIDGGEIFTRNMVHYYTKQTLPPTFDEECISCDLSFGGVKSTNDPCAIQVWGRKGADHYLLLRVKKRLTFVEMCEMIKYISAKYPLARRKIVEKKANGQAVIDSLNSTIGGFVAYDPKMTDKVGRANAVVPYWESGNIYLPNEEIDNTIDEFVEELMHFPNSEHDDEVDAMTQYLVQYQYSNGGRILTDSFYGALADTIRGFKV